MGIQSNVRLVSIQMSGGETLYHIIHPNLYHGPLHPPSEHRQRQAVGDRWNKCKGAREQGECSESRFPRNSSNLLQTDLHFDWLVATLIRPKEDGLCQSINSAPAIHLILQL